MTGLSAVRAGHPRSPNHNNARLEESECLGDGAQEDRGIMNNKNALYIYIHFPRLVLLSTLAVSGQWSAVLMPRFFKLWRPLDDN